MTTNQQTAQEIAIAKLERQGFRFSNWIAACPDADGGSTDGQQTAVMIRSKRYTHEYREVEPDGSVN